MTCQNADNLMIAKRFGLGQTAHVMDMETIKNQSMNTRIMPGLSV